jgi:hypothetical protein
MLSQWVCEKPLTSGASFVLNTGHYPDVGGTTLLYTDTSKKIFMTWAIMTEKAATFLIEGSLGSSGLVFDTLLTVTITGATLATPYDLAAPYSNTGVFVITRPIIRLTLSDAAAAAHAYTRAYVKAW